MRFVAAILISVLVLFAVACNGDDGDSPDPTASPDGATQAPPTEVPESPTAEPTEEPSPSPAPDAEETTEFSFPAEPDPANAIATLTDVRVGEHPEGDGFDRIVLEFDEDRPAGVIEYVDAAEQCGSGLPVEDLQGDGMLIVRLDATQAHDDQGEATIEENEIDGPGTAIAEARQICDFEGVVEWVVGVDGGEQPFRVYLLQEPSRVAIDIEWP